MKQLYKRQETYEKGIIENWQQDSFQQPYGLLYLENFNPNLEQKTLIKRLCESIVVYKNEKIYFDTESFTNNVFDYPENREITLSNELLLTSNPNYNKTYLSFLKRLPKTGTQKEKDFCLDDTLIALNPECTGIVARTWEYENGQEELAWHEPFKDGATYPGWYTCGLYTDHVRYAEMLLFTTLLDKIPYGTDLDKYLYPLYIWGLWDITKKRDDDKVWWNGIDLDLTDKKKYRRWKVKTPTMELLRNEDIGHAWWNKTTNSWERKGSEKPIELLFMENDLDITTNNQVYSNGDYGVMNRSGTFIVQSVTERESYLAKDKDDYYPKLPLVEMYGQNNIFYHSFQIAEFDGYIDYLTNRGYWIRTSDINTVQYIRKEYWINEYREYPYADEKIQGNIKLATTDNYTERSDGDKHWKTQNCLTHLYLRYIDAEFPRPWHKGEKIPFVITVKIDGVETVLHKDIYIIQTEQGMTSPTTSANDGFLMSSNYGVYDSIKDGYVTSNQVTVPAGANNYPDVYSLGIRTTDNVMASPDVKLIPINGNTQADLLLSNSLQFTIRINKDYFGKLLEENPIEFNLYISEPSETERWIDLVGLQAVTEIPEGYYAKPNVKDINIHDIDFDYSKFRLVKSFAIDGQSQDIEYKNYRGTPTRTNAWVESNDIGTPGTTGYLYAVPDINDGTGFIENNRIPFFDNTFNKRGKPYTDNDRMWYSDFTLWDYPKDAPPLTLNNSGEYWKGLGAKHIEIIQGRTFIAGCIDDEGKEEQATVRFSIVQNGVTSKDVFVKEDEIKFGHSRITALLNYRDQLWVFNEYGQYRMLPHNIFDVSTWEVLDVQHAQGCLSNKLVTITPNGVCFASRNGIWISDGRMPASLTDNPEKGLAIQSLYQRLMLGKSYVYREQADPGEVYIDEDLNYNPYTELYYNKDTDELILSTPVKKTDNELYTPLSNNFINEDWEYFTHEARLTYSFAHNNWRMDVYRVNTDVLNVAQTVKRQKTYSGRGIFHLSENEFNVVKEMYSIADPANGRNSNYDYSFVTFNTTDKEAIYDSTYYLYNGNAIEDIYKVIGEMVTHEIGDGENDFVLRRAYLENSPRETTLYDKNIYGYNEFIYEGATVKYELPQLPSIDDDITAGFLINDLWRDTRDDTYYVCLDNTDGNAVWQKVISYRDPYIFYELRNRSWLSQTNYINYNDIVSINMNAKKGQNPFLSLMQTPGNTNYSPSDKVVGRESLVLLFPRNTKFRRARFKILTEIIAKIRSYTVEYAKFKRRAK